MRWSIPLFDISTDDRVHNFDAFKDVNLFKLLIFLLYNDSQPTFVKELVIDFVIEPKFKT